MTLAFLILFLILLQVIGKYSPTV